MGVRLRGKQMLESPLTIKVQERKIDELEQVIEDRDGDEIAQNHQSAIIVGDKRCDRPVGHALWASYDVPAIET